MARRRPRDRRARLHKAAALRLPGPWRRRPAHRHDMVWLDRTVEIDLDRFRVAAERAVWQDAENLAAAAIALYGGPLLPDDLFEPGLERTRDEARLLYLDCLRLARQWDGGVAGGAWQRAGAPRADAGHGRQG